MEKKDKKIFMKNKSVVLFEDLPVRRVWVEKEGKWYFAIVDIVAILTESANANTYWRVLKKRLIDEGSIETVTNCNRLLKMKARDGKMRDTDTYNTEGIFRIIQSIPSKKAEPFKKWLAKVGYERIQETSNPEMAVNRARKNWQNLGYSEKWIEQRMRGQEIRNKLTDYWKENEVKEGVEYAKLTDIIHKEWSELTTAEHKKLKGLKSENLRDNMSEAEILFTALAELSTNQIAKSEKAKGFIENKESAKKGGRISRNARKELEKKTGKKIVSSNNFLPYKNKIKKLK